MGWISIKDLVHLFYPPLCVCCKNRLMESETHICITCLLHLPLSLPTNNSPSVDNELEAKLAGLFPFEHAQFFAYYEEGNSTQRIVHSIKYRKNKDLAIFMGELAGKKLKASTFLDTIDYIVPIPLHPKRLKQRSFNQSEKICEGISSTTAIPTLTTAFLRIRNNKSQTKFSKSERMENVKNIFSLSPIFVEQLRNKHILLVDDVITSGATIQSLIQSIPKDLGLKVSIFCIGNAR